MALLLRQVVRLYARVARTNDDEKVKTLSLGPVYRSVFDVGQQELSAKFPEVPKPPAPPAAQPPTPSSASASASGSPSSSGGGAGAGAGAGALPPTPHRVKGETFGAVGGLKKSVSFKVATEEIVSAGLSAEADHRALATVLAHIGRWAARVDAPRLTTALGSRRSHGAVGTPSPLPLGPGGGAAGGFPTPTPSAAGGWTASPAAGGAPLGAGVPSGRPSSKMGFSMSFGGGGPGLSGGGGGPVPRLLKDLVPMGGHFAGADPLEGLHHVEVRRGGRDGGVFGRGGVCGGCREEGARARVCLPCVLQASGCVHVCWERARGRALRLSWCERARAEPWRDAWFRWGWVGLGNRAGTICPQSSSQYV
jgi:hypothetical protein